MKHQGGLPSLPEPSTAAYAEAERRVRQSFAAVRASCGWIEAPFGPVFLARTEAGLCAVGFSAGEDEQLAALERRRLLPEMAPGRLDAERRALEGYFAGRERCFTLAVDLSGLTPFQRSVLAAAAAIPYGEVVSYGDIARRIDRPAANRAVGNALGHNPVPIVIPCHRVVASGGLGGYTGGLAVKRALMRIEGIPVQGDLLG